MKIKLMISFALTFVLLTGCSINDIKQYTESSAYQLGYKTAKDLQSTGDYLNNLNSWIKDNGGDNSDSNLNVSASDCAKFWEFVGLSSALSFG